MQIRWKRYIAASALAVAFAGCGDNDNPSTPATPDAAAMNPTPDAPPAPTADAAPDLTMINALSCDELIPAMQEGTDGASQKWDIDITRWPEVQPVFPPNTEMEDAITALIEKMTLEQKVGQMVMADIGSNGADRPDVMPAELQQYRLGAVLNGGNSAPNDDFRAEPQEWLDLAESFYQNSIDETGAEVVIPYLWGTDAVHGHSAVIGATIFPQNIGLGAANDPDLIEEIGRVTAREIAVTGIDLNFSPTIATVRDDRWGRTYESFSEKSDIVFEYASRYVEGIQGSIDDADWLTGDGRVIATAKHFLGDGGTERGVDQGDNTDSEADLIQRHGRAYTAAIEAGAQVIMASYNSWQGDKVHGMKYLLTCVLRERWNFDGVVLSDWNAHGQVAGCDNQSCPSAVLGGVDMFMIPHFADWPQFIANTVAQVESGVIPEARIDEAVRRILRVKMRAGLLGPDASGAPKSRALAGQFDLLASDEHKAVARDAVRKSLVLLKNKGDTLPLAGNSKVLVVGKSADSIKHQAGGWTISWQGSGTTNADFPQAESILTGIRDAVNQGDTNVTFYETAAEIPDTVPDDNFDVAVVVIGEDPYAEFCGDIRSDADCSFDGEWQLRANTLSHGLRYPADRAVIDRIKEVQADLPVVTVFLSGRPLHVNYELNRSDAFVAGWLPGSEGAGVADVLFDNNGTFGFTGKLSFSWPAESCQQPLNDGDAGTPLFAYGYGLAYGDASEVPDDLSEAELNDCDPQ
ncbi:MAG: hypothetical protein Tsb0020_45770 [Haliangiales bacterium]